MTTRRHRAAAYGQGLLIFWAIITLIVLVVIGTVAMRFMGAKKGGFGGGPVAVNTITLTPQPLDITYTAQGTVQATRRIAMNPEIAGIITRINVTEGQFVSAGTPLLTLKAQRQAAGVAQSRAGLAASQQAVHAQRTLIHQAQASVDAAEAQAQLAKQEFSDYEKLHQQDVISRLELDQKRTATTQATAQLTQAKAQLAQANVQLAQSKATQQQASAMVQEQQSAYGETILRAPFSGVVGEIVVDPGDYVMLTEAVLTLVNPNSQLEVSFTVPEQDVAQLSRNQSITITPSRPSTLKTTEALPTGRGVITFIDPIINPQTRTATIKARLTQTPAALRRDGQFVTVNVVTETLPNALLVPESAVFPQGEKYYVYVVGQSNSDKAPQPTAVLTEVTPGERFKRSVALLSGVTAGQQVVTDGLIKLTDGAPLMLPNTPPSKTSTSSSAPTPPTDDKE